MNFNDKIIQCLTTSFPISSPGMAPIDAVMLVTPALSIQAHCLASPPSLRHPSWQMR